MTQTEQEISSLKYPIFGHAPSLNHARNYAETILNQHHSSEVHQVLDYYHNTLIEEVLKAIGKHNDK